MVRTSPPSSDLPSDAATATASKLNSLRAAVLGANDGIVSVASVVTGVTGAAASHHAVVIAGFAALAAGALSMAVGEYVSVSSQSDAEKAYIAEEVDDLRQRPEEELIELAREYEKLGVSAATAKQVAAELTAHDALKAHLRIHFNIDPNDLNSPWQAAISSLVAFTIGGMIPMAALVFAPDKYRFAMTVVAVAVALIVAGYVSARAGNARRLPAVLRVFIGGLLAMAVTYGIGLLFGVATA